MKPIKVNDLIKEQYNYYFKMNKLNPKKSDTTHAIIRSVLGTIPFGGTAAIEIFNRIITPPIEERRNRWIVEITESLQKLEKQNKIVIDDLKNNEEFIDLFLKASQSAIRNNHKVKFDAIRNIVLNK